MLPAMVYLAWVALVGCAAASFFFALAETSLFSLGKFRTRRLVERHPKTGELLQNLLAQPQDLLATVALGNTFANACMVALLLWREPNWHAWHALVAVLALLLLQLMGCEVIPKTLAVRDPEFWALRVATPMRWFTRITRPFRRGVQWLNDTILKQAARQSITPTRGLSDEEYHELVDLAFQQGTLAAAEKEIILQIIALDRRTVGEIMKPRAQMAALSDEATLEEMIAAARRHKHVRIPIYDETPDTIVGVLNTQALLLNPGADLSEVVDFPAYVPASMNLLQLLKSLQRQRRGMAIVLDEFGGTAGIITMEDILEEVLGEIRSEGESEGFVMEKLDECRWRVNGTMRLDDFRREYPALADYPGVETIGGLVTALMEIVPHPGQSIAYRGLQFKVTVADDRRVREVLVEKAAPARAKGGAA
jgi:putative hemolysin